MLMTLFSKFLLNILRKVNLAIFTLNVLMTSKKNYLFRKSICSDGAMLSTVYHMELILKI